MGELQESLNYALCAGPLFDVTEQSDYVQTLVGKCIDEYMKLREKGEISGEEVQIDSRLEAIVQRMFKRFVNYPTTRCSLPLGASFSLYLLLST